MKEHITPSDGYPFCPACEEEIELSKKGYRKCERCGERKPDVSDGYEPYVYEIYNKEVPCTWCAQCYRENAWEI